MKFNEIFEKDGLYVSEGFDEGVAFRIREGFIYVITYNSINDLMPEVELYSVHKSLFNKEYVRVNNVRQLFK